MPTVPVLLALACDETLISGTYPMPIFASVFLSLDEAGVPMARRTTETDWQDVVSLLRATNRNLEDPELRTIISLIGEPRALGEIKRSVSNL
jgi:hypothetical protein